jgi:hypothetical protein
MALGAVKGRAQAPHLRRQRPKGRCARLAADQASAADQLQLLSALDRRRRRMVALSCAGQTGPHWRASLLSADPRSLPIGRNRV